MSDILFKLLDLLLGGFLKRRSERKKRVEQLEVFKRRILNVGLVNDLPVELHNLRMFLIENNLMETPGFSEFFAKWLTKSVVLMGTRVANPFKSDAIKQLQEELDVLQL